MAEEIVNCASYEPGHNVHFIQARVKDHLPRFWARVDLIGPKAVRVVTDKQDRVLFHHKAIELYMWTLVAFERRSNTRQSRSFSTCDWMNSKARGRTSGSWLICQKTTHHLVLN